MKKIISLVLALTMVLSLFTGLGITSVAEETATSIKANACSVWNELTDLNGKAEFWDRTYNAPASGYTKDKPTYTLTAGSAAIGMKQSIVFDSEYVNGIGSGDPHACDPMLRIFTAVDIPAATDTLMMYVDFPSFDTSLIGDASKWRTNVSITDLRFTQNGKSYTVTTEAMSFDILSYKGKAWKNVSFTSDANRNCADLTDFEGYIKIDIKDVPNYAALVEAGFDETQDFTVNRLEFCAPQFGGVMGPVIVGGLYGLSEDNSSTMLQVGDAEAESMTYFTADAIDANLFAPNQPAVGQSSFYIGVMSNAGVHSATALSAANICPIDKSRPAVSYVSPDIVGYGHSVNPQCYMNINSNSQNTTMLTSHSDIIVYIEFPYINGIESNGMRIDHVAKGDNGTQDTFFKNLKDAVEILELDSNAWMPVKTDSNGSFDVPNGFKGYIKFHFEKTTAYQNAVTNSTVYDPWRMYYYFKHWGGEYGNIVIGGQWYGSESDSISMYLDGNVDNQMLLTKPDYDRIEMTEATPTASVGKIDWSGDTSVATVSRGEHIASVGKTQSIIFTADEVEGQNHPAYGTNGDKYRVSSLSLTGMYEWINPDYDEAIIYVEVPNYTGGYGLRITATNWKQPGVTQYDNFIWSSYYAYGVYDYLPMGGTEWQTATADSAGGLNALEPGFKGHIKLHYDTMQATNNGQYVNKFEYDANRGINFDPSKPYAIAEITFMCGSYGGEAGALKVGGVYAVNYDGGSVNAKLSVDSKVRDLTKYETATEIALKEFNDAVNAIDTENITFADIEKADALLAAYDSFDAETKAMLTAEQVAAMEAAVAGTNIYRPYFLGVAARKPDGSNNAGIKVGTSLDTVSAAAEGYTVVEYGTVMMPMSKFSDGYFIASTDGAQILNVTVSENAEKFTWNAVYESNKWEDYHKNFYFRSYVIYTKGEETFTVWNATATSTVETIGDRDDPAGRLHVFYNDVTAPYYVTSIAGAANKFGYSVYAGQLYGNITGDQFINVDDAVALRKIILGMEKTPAQKYIADTNADNKVNVKDLVRLKKYLADTSIKMGAALKEGLVLA